MFEELDPDLREIAHHNTRHLEANFTVLTSVESVLLLQILRELKKVEPEEKSPSVRGFEV